MRKYWIVLIRHGQGIGLQKEKGQTFLPALSCVVATTLIGQESLPLLPSPLPA